MKDLTARRIAVIGNPNSGKTALFNRLTGAGVGLPLSVSEIVTSVIDRNETGDAERDPNDS